MSKRSKELYSLLKESNGGAYITKSGEVRGGSNSSGTYKSSGNSQTSSRRNELAALLKKQQSAQKQNTAPKTTSQTTKTTQPFVPTTLNEERYTKAVRNALKSTVSETAAKKDKAEKAYRSNLSYNYAGGGMGGGIGSGIQKAEKKAKSAQNSVLKHMGYDSKAQLDADYMKAQADVANWDSLGQYLTKYSDDKGKAGWEKYKKENSGKKKSDLKTDSGKLNLLTAYSSSSGNAPADAIGAAINAERKDTSYKLPSDDWEEQYKNIYGYLYGNGQTAAAEEFAKRVNNAYASESQQEELDKIKSWAQKNFGTGAASTVASIASMPLTSADYMQRLAQMAAHGEMHTSSMPSISAYMDAATGGVTEKLNDKYGTINEAVPIIGGKGVGDVYGLGLNMAQSVGLASLGGSPLTLSSFFTSQATRSIDEAKANGASDEQALLFGTLMGAAEAIPEMVEADTFIKALKTSSTSGVFRNALKQSAVEGLGEQMTDVLGLAIDQNIMKDKSEINRKIAELVGQGMSQEEASKAVWQDWVENSLYDGLAGAIMGGGTMAVTSPVANAVQNIRTYGKSSSYATEDAQRALVTEGMSTEAGEKANTYAEKLNARLDAGKSLNSVQLAKQANLNEKGFNAYDTEQVKTAVENRLKQLGETENTAEVAQAVAKRTTGQRLSSTESKALRNSKYGQRVFNELSEQNIESGEYSSDWAQSIGTVNLKPGVYSKTLETAGTTAQEKTEAEQVSEKYGEQAEQVKKIYEAGSPDTSAQAFDASFKVAYMAGQNGDNLQNIVNLPAVRALNNAQVNAAYKLGQAAANNNTAVNMKGEENNGGELRIRRGSERNDGKSAGEQARSVAEEAGRDTQERVSAVGRSAKDAGAATLNYSRKVSSQSLGITNGTSSSNIRTIEKGSATADMKRAERRANKFGYNVVFFADGALEVERDGVTTKNRAMIDFNTKTIYCRVDHTQFTADQIMRHELGHELIRQGKIDLEKTKQQMIARFGEEKINEFIQQYVEAYEAEGSVYTAEQMWEEIVCDSLGEMNVFDSRFNAKDNAVMLDTTRQLAQQQSNENESRAPPVEESGQKFSLDGVNKYGVEVYTTSDEVKRLSRKEKQKKFLNIMKEEYRGRTAKFVRNGHLYYATFDKEDIKKNIYGDKQSSASGYKAKLNVGASGNVFELVENAKYNGSKFEQGKTTAAHKHVQYWDYFVKTVQIDNEVFDLVANIRKTSESEYVYTISLVPNNEIEASAAQQPVNKAGINKAANASENSIPNKSEKVNQKTSEDIDSKYLELAKNPEQNREELQKMVDEAAKKAGYTIKAYHGTVNNFNIFDKDLANPENDLGKGFYFSNNKADVEANYATEEGPDLTNKITRLAEQMEWQDEYADMDYDERYEEAKKQFVKGEPRTISAVLRMENPVVIGRRNELYEDEQFKSETYFDFEETYDEDTEEYGEAEGLLVDFAEALSDELGNYYGGEDVNVYELYENYDGYNASDLEKKAKELVQYVEDDEGNLAGHEIVRAAFERMGFDGIVDHTVGDKFNMDGLTKTTTHYIVFNSQQAKQSDPVTYDSKGDIIPLSERFKSDNPDIRFSQDIDSTGKKLSKEQAEYFADSAIRDADGKLQVMYRGGNTDINVFDRKKSKPSNLYGRGFYFTDSETHAKQYGNAKAYYLNITKPLKAGQSEITRAQLKKFLNAVAEDEDYGLENYGYGATVDSVLSSVYNGSDFDMLQDINASAIGDFVAAVELFNKVNGTNYDGIVTPTETVAFKSSQIKLTSNTKPTKSEDVRFSEDLPSMRKLQKQNEKLKQQVDYWKGQLKITPDTVKPVASKLIKAYDAQLKVEDIREDILNVADVYNAEAAKGKAFDWNKVKESVYPLAEYIVDNAEVQIESGEEENYKNIKRYLKTTGISFNDKSDIADYEDFRKRNFGRILIKKDGLPIDTAWKEMQEMFGTGYFPEDIINPADMMEHLSGLVEAMQPKYANPFDYNRNEAVEACAGDIMAEIMQEGIRRTTPTFADKQAAKLEAAKQGYNEELAKLNKDHAAELQKQKMDSLRELEDMKKAYEAQAKKAAAKMVSKRLEYFRQRRESSSAKKKYKDRITKSAKKLSDWIQKNSDKEHVPAALREPVLELVTSVDFTSKRALNGGDYTQNDRKFQKNLATLNELLKGQQNYVEDKDNAVDRIGEYLDISEENRMFLDDVVSRIAKGEKLTVNSMTEEQLRDFSKFMQNLTTAIRKANATLANAHFENIPTMAKNSMQHMDALGEAGALASSGISKFVAWQNATPYYAFKRFGYAGETLFDGLPAVGKSSQIRHRK